MGGKKARKSISISMSFFMISYQEIDEEEEEKEEIHIK